MKIIVFGAGKGLTRMLQNGAVNPADIIAVCDNDRSKSGTAMELNEDSCHLP